MIGENDYDLEDDDKRKNEAVYVDALDPDFRAKVDEHYKKEYEESESDEEEVSGDWRENLETEKEETEETEEIESDTLTNEEKAERDYPDMAKDGMPYRQDFTQKEEPDEELKKRYPDMNVDDL